jgi:5-methylcytosine-specific restriction endonuclease McrA
LRATGANTLAQARQHHSWGQTQRRIAKVVIDMPVCYLQNLTGATVVFLYDPKVEDGNLQLLPGVAFYLRRFQGFVHQLVRTGWLEHIRSNRRNTPLIGQSGDLESFLFGTARADLSGVAKLLAPLQNHRCFFCRESLKTGAMAVDHFIPWSRYPRDTALNFVMAHATCNNDKRELLAGERHLDHWLDRNLWEGAEITGVLQELGFLIEPEITQMVAKWAYQQAVGSGAHVWLARGQTEKISPDLMRIFA